MVFFFKVKNVACEQDFLLGGVKQARREHASERRQGKELPQPPLSRLLSCASRSSAFHNIPQMESLLAGYKKCSCRA